MDLSKPAQDHLESLRKEIEALIVHSNPVSKQVSATTCWGKNSEDVNVALQVIGAASQSIHDGVTRFNLVYKSNPSETASESMSKETGGFCQQMVASLTLLTSVGASGVMVAYFSAGVRAILHALKDLVDALLDPSRHAHLNGLTGIVWQSCKELQQAPKTNKLACRRQMMQWSVAIKDTIDEFAEAVKTAAAAIPEAGKSDACPDATVLAEQFAIQATVSGIGETHDLNFDEMDEDYSATELPCVEASIDILRVFRHCLKAANESFNTLDSARPKAGGEVGGGAAREGWLQERLTWAKSVQTHLDEANECAGELGILLYPPLDGGELLRRASDLETSLTAFCDVFDASEEGESRARESTLRTAVVGRISVLKKTIGDL
ncbi:unnamed protein product [Hapterophycus canaliculatus]